MNLKYNINKIHSDLTSEFFRDGVKLEEKSSNRFGNYFELSIFKEGLEAKVLISMPSLNNVSFNWSYFSNPLDDNSHLVERHSSVDTFVSDIKDIFEKKRFSEIYLKEINNN